MGVLHRNSNDTELPPCNLPLSVFLPFWVPIHFFLPNASFFSFSYQPSNFSLHPSSKKLIHAVTFPLPAISISTYATLLLFYVYIPFSSHVANRKTGGTTEQGHVAVYTQAVAK